MPGFEAMNVRPFNGDSTAIRGESAGINAGQAVAGAQAFVRKLVRAAVEKQACTL